ncbi:MAG: UDP-N-acetylglucosamine--N-acetylmuramyl-(pentapeptide) pyrophosphoryl-undecaprenol N-acetylglucosamine transferase [Bacteroidia bacterium]|nr:UDP-N-acetylglucosamine--N-acetylmuramyl-(pentapeptide) pyrophosphoryl-undecaprenol N-acetylglucosamine transferase [Bacteroidia bacterium]MDW8016053.1 UDP-N-acetylglucosamine--N-acetylmuramyl-(pentapeptide) pyrophosphoryl-undecaprenol N-acetylglucosamine transferase [Bacteroidia bacterium]
MGLVIAAGGTGGHVFPALAVAKVWRQRWPELPIQWVGTRGGREEKWVQAAHIPFFALPGRGWQPRAGFRNLRLLYSLPSAFWAANALLDRLNPQVIFSTGGYPGFMPALWAVLHHRPLFFLELNRRAGRTIRWLSRFATRTFGAFPQTDGVRKAQWVGVPVRFSPDDKARFSSAEAKAAWGFPSDRPLILVLGGSQGSSALNQAVASCVPEWVQAGASLLWQVGLDAPVSPSPQIRLLPFIEDMAQAYAAADVVVSRAGGSTLGELAWWGKAGVLVPSPYVAEDHQRHNAAYWSEQGAAILVEESQLPQLKEAVLTLLKEPDRRLRLAQASEKLARLNAAEEIAQTLYQSLHGLA